MKVIAIFLSVLMLIYLTYTFVVEDKSSQKSEQVLKTSRLVEPAYISDARLEVEQVWQQLKADRIKAKQPIEDKVDNELKSKDLLTVGDNQYTLYGIFNANKDTSALNNNGKPNNLPSQAFILIKALNIKDNKNKPEEAQMLKVVQGEELSKGIVLFAVTSNSISFKQAGELIEFQLFDAKKQP